MEFPEFEAHVRDALKVARESLARIEEHVRAEGESAALMETSRLYAEFCMHARDYIGTAAYGKPLPRRFAQKVEAIHAELAARRAGLDRLDLHPSPEDLEALVRWALLLPDRVR